MASHSISPFNSSDTSLPRWKTRIQTILTGQCDTAAGVSDAAPDRSAGLMELNRDAPAETRLGQPSDLPVLCQHHRRMVLRGAVQIPCIVPAGEMRADSRNYGAHRTPRHHRDARVCIHGAGYFGAVCNALPPVAVANRIENARAMLFSVMLEAALTAVAVPVARAAFDHRRCAIAWRFGPNSATPAFIISE